MRLLAWATIALVVGSAAACSSDGSLPTSGMSQSLGTSTTLLMKPTGGLGHSDANSVGCPSDDEWACVADGTSFAANDGDRTYVYSTAPGGRQGTWYSGAPHGAVAQVTTNVVAAAESGGTGTITVSLYDAGKLLATGTAHSLTKKYTAYSDTFAVAVASADSLQTWVTFSAAKLRYTEIWLAAVLATPASDAGRDGSTAQDGKSESSSPPDSGGGCPQGTALPDGCSSAPACSPQFPHLLDVKSVVMLNIVPGSGYTDGTYDWTTSGGGGSGATGKVTVSGGMVGGSSSQGYTIADPGSGYTSRPEIVVSGLTGGKGASITPSVYEATPHNAPTRWNMPGVDYCVGVPNGTALKDPTMSANLPSGASYASSVVTIRGCNVTLSGFDFTLHDTVVSVDITSKSCTTTIEDSKFSANGTALQPIANLLDLGPGGAFVFQRNEYDGLAPIGDPNGSGFDVNDPIQAGQGGNVTLRYNYFHNFDSKVIQVSGDTPSAPFTEQFNLFADFGSCKTPPCAHGEAEYTYGGGAISFTGQFNTYVQHFHTGSADLTALHAVEADDVDIDGLTDDHNVILAPGPQETCNEYNQTGYVAAATVYDGQQEGGELTHVSFAFNYLDNSGTFFPWYHATGTGVTHTNNVDTGTGGPCNCNVVQSDGRCD
jgi:hypothetical protein